MSRDLGDRIEAGLRADEKTVQAPGIGDIERRVRRRVVRRRGALLVVAAGASVAAVIGLRNPVDDGSISVTVDCPAADAPCVDDVPDPVADDVSEPVPVFGTRENFSIVAALDQVPIGDGPVDVMWVEVFDFLAAGDATGDIRPTGSTDVGVVGEWLLHLTFDSPTVHFRPPVRLGGVRDISEYRDEIGFSFTDIDATIETGSIISFDAFLPETIAVFAGDLTLNTDIDVGDGVLTFGEGEDGELRASTQTAARKLGRPLRAASSDGLVVLSDTTPIVAAWLDPESARLGSDAAFAEAAGLLDQRDVIGAVLVRVGPLLEENDFTPFDVFAVGWGVTDGEAAITFVYITVTDDDAQMLADELESAFFEPSPDHRIIVDGLTFDEVTTKGRAVVIAAHPSGEDPRAAVAYEMVNPLSPLLWQLGA